MTKHQDPAPVMAVDLPVDAPLVLKVHPTGALEVQCFQGISGSSDPISMKLMFSPAAAGQLASAVKALLDRGVIRIENTGGYGIQ